MPMDMDLDALGSARGALGRHERVALCFSGGKDSTAVAWLLREHWDRVVFYHMDTGDLLPEVYAVVDEVQPMVPRFVIVRSDPAAWMEEHGLPSDLVPYSSHDIPQVTEGARRLSSRFDCCHANLMRPLWDRIKADGCTLVIRGTKRCDMRRLPMRDGEVLDGVELLLPVLEWSDAEVMAYLRRVGAPVSSAYGHFVNLPECATCPAWWGEGRAAYLRDNHPELFRELQKRMNLVMAEVGPVAAKLAAELRVLSGGK